LHIALFMTETALSSTALASQRLQIRGVEYAIADTGTAGPAVLLLHGWPDDKTIWRYQLAYLSSLGFRAIAVDWPGHGESSIPSDVRRYHVRELGADTIALLDALNLDRVHLIAHDYGATVSWETVANYRDRFLSYCALSVGHAVEILRDMAMGHLGDYWWLVLHGMDRASRYWYLSNDAQRFRHKFAAHPDGDRILSKLTSGQDTGFWTIWERANPSYDVFYRQFFAGQRHQRIGVPTLGIYGRQDEWMTEGQLSRCYRYVDAVWRYESIPGGHWLQLERPDAVNGILGAWLERWR
jgi:pimeloyl-ACP methyl ester carboxylesterase